jgi:perosamine synthetase
MITTNMKDWARKAKYLTTQAKDDPIEFIHHEVGYNYRLTNIQAAMGCAQLEQIDEYIKLKRSHAKIYENALQDIQGLRLMQEASWAKSVFWMYTILVETEEYGMDRRELMYLLASFGVHSRPLWFPLHKSQSFLEAPQAICPIAERIQDRTLSIPSSVGLTVEQQERVIGILRDKPARSQ